VLERKAPPTFEIVIEIMQPEQMAIHHDVATTVDQMLRGRAPRPEIRQRQVDGEIEILQPADETIDIAPPRLRYERDHGGRENGGRENGGRENGRRVSLPRQNGTSPGDGKEPGPTVRIFPYGVSRSRLEKAIRDLHVPAFLTKSWDDADAIIALKAQCRREPSQIRDAIGQNKPTFLVRSNTQIQIESVLREMFAGHDRADEDQALREAKDAIERVAELGEPVELMPQNAYLRRLQHQMAEQADLVSSSVGAEPRRRVRIARA